MIVAQNNERIQKASAATSIPKWNKHTNKKATRGGKSQLENNNDANKKKNWVMLCWN